MPREQYGPNTDETITRHGYYDTCTRFVGGPLSGRELTVQQMATGIKYGTVKVPLIKKFLPHKPQEKTCANKEVLQTPVYVTKLLTSHEIEEKCRFFVYEGMTMDEVNEALTNPNSKFNNF